MQVSFLDNSPPQIVDENTLNVIDRSLHLGDVVKRRPEDTMSGIIVNGKMKLSLEHTFTGQTLENVDSEHVKSAFDFYEGIIISLLCSDSRSIYIIRGSLGRANRRGHSGCYASINK